MPECSAEHTNPAETQVFFDIGYDPGYASPIFISRGDCAPGSRRLSYRKSRNSLPRNPPLAQQPGILESLVLQPVIPPRRPAMSRRVHLDLQQQRILIRLDRA